MARPRSFEQADAIDRAIECFWSRGYQATSVRDLSDAMHIGGASLYNAFGDKRTLFAQALERYASGSMRERIERLEATLGPRQAIEAFLGEIVERSVSDPECRGCLLVNTALDAAPHDAEIGRLVAGYFDEIRGFFRRCLVAGRRRGEIAKGLDVDAFSAHLMGIVLAMRVLARTPTVAGADKRAQLEAVAKPALAQLRPPRPARRSKP